MVLRLVKLSGLEPRDRDRHRIRILQVGERCDVLGELKAWAKSSSDEYKRALNGLKRIAANENLTTLGTIKRVGDSHQIIQIAGDSGRLYCFQDDNGNTVICVGTFWIGRGDKQDKQNKAIQDAESLMRRWRSAKPVPGVEDLRREPRRK